MEISQPDFDHEEADARKRKIIATFAVLIFMVVIVFGASELRDKKTSGMGQALGAETSQPSNSTADNTVADTTAADSTAGQAGASVQATTPVASDYKDGSYTATGSYVSPGGQQAITIVVTIKDDVITATTAQSGASEHDSAEYQVEFISGYKSLIVGKDIDSVKLSRVSGSSLTSTGFNNALEKIKQQAQA